MATEASMRDRGFDDEEHLSMMAVDAILGTEFAQKAIETYMASRGGRPCAANLFRDLLEAIDRMAQHCQLTEFTEHGLPHLSSLVNRIGSWTREDGSPLLASLSHDETFLLMLAVLSHDVGMLSQREDDLVEGERVKYARIFSDLPMWVRRTHVPRLEGVLRRVLVNSYEEFLRTPTMALAIRIARSHQDWPNGERYQEIQQAAVDAGFDPDRIKALAGVLAVADLLDEDSSRCDSMTLFANKAGDLMNRAHWLRHMLTSGPPLRVDRGVIAVKVSVPGNLDGRIDAALEGLRNHLRLAQAYNPLLEALRAAVRVVFCDPELGDPVPSKPPFEILLCEPDVHLLRTLSDEALPVAGDETTVGCDAEVLGVTLSQIDRSVFDAALGPVGTRSGRTDLEITYAASCSRGEDQRQKALALLRDEAIAANARGDLSTVQRLTALVLRDLARDKKLSLNGAFWAAAYSLHWAARGHDLAEIRHLIEQRLGEDRHDRDKYRAGIEGVPLRWRVLWAALEIWQHHRVTDYAVIKGLLERRQEFGVPGLRPEEQIAWHDLLEGLWARDYLRRLSQSDVNELFAALRKLESESPSSQRLITELQWRIAVQSSCLCGFGAWESLLGPAERDQYGLSANPGQESMAALWVAWFGDRRECLADLARAARKANPPGSEHYVSAVEAEWLVRSFDLILFSSDDDSYYRRQEFASATERDEPFRLITGAVTSLLDTDLAPKQEGTTYIGGRGALGSRFEGILGQRIALRRWYLASWHKVVGYDIRSRLSTAHVMLLEGDGDEIAQSVLDALVDLPWGVPYSGKGEQLLGHIFPRIELGISPDELTPVQEAIAKSPRRIGNVRHPGLKIMGDSISGEMMPTLVQWTMDALQGQQTSRVGPDTFAIWTGLMENNCLSPDTWRDLQPLLQHACNGMRVWGDADTKITHAAIAQAPWPVAAPLVKRIADQLSADDQTDFVRTAKEVVINGLLNRKRDDWRVTDEHQALIRALERLARTGSDENDAIVIEFVSRQDPIVGSRSIAQRWLAALETVRDRAVARGERDSASFGGERYPVGPSAPIDDEIAKRAAEALVDLWNAQRPTRFELNDGATAASHLFGASSGLGRDALAQALVKIMATERTAIAFPMGKRQSCRDVPWIAAARCSASFPDAYLAEIGRQLSAGIVDSPIKSSWAQARFAVEILMRSGVAEEVERAKAALLAIRVRTLKHPDRAAESLLSSVDRLVDDEDGWSERSESIMEFLVAWALEATLAPEPNLRKACAQACGRLASHVTGSARERVIGILERLRKDTRLRVRAAAERELVALADHHE